eukprot:CAMPEP_0174306320 /NCGR_PEP_ID=MMETSP0810-20121108/371_1 /TAXON_ID=73025 ORGANISM="Eutreptiella gymnastica-like, Strain CCMP1594" /NCGR_SAMPLE_ID=MMETSP0810 /ASSEMBLY_ACC=CAM_ASM_000659 /LENGTH=88 /DNA_ID=CAMNT_0015412993 /DNA_START=484 /DNA_END=750 /DNA_ORIENTATION=+
MQHGCMHADICPHHACARTSNVSPSDNGGRLSDNAAFNHEQLKGAQQEGLSGQGGGSWTSWLLRTGESRYEGEAMRRQKGKMPKGAKM